MTKPTSLLSSAQGCSPLRYTQAERNTMRNIGFILTLATMTLLPAQPAPTYHVTHTYALGGDGSWDYVVPDPPTHRLYIARQNRVMVVDEDSGKLLGEVTGIQGAHGTAVAPATGHGFATSGKDQSVVAVVSDASRLSCLKLPRVS